MSGSDPSVRRRASSGAGTSNTGGDLGGSAAGGSTEGGYDCPGRPFETVLASPDPAAVAQLEEGDLLDVVAVEQPRGVVAVTFDGTPVGALTSHILQLRHCMSHGTSYEAEVIEVVGGSVRIEVRGALA